MSNAAFRNFKAAAERGLSRKSPSRPPTKSTSASYTKAVYARKGSAAAAVEARDAADNELYLMENRLQRRRVASSLAPYDKKGVSFDDPLVKFSAVAGILLIGSGLFMKTYRKYFPADSAVADAVTAGADVSEIVGDVAEEVGETVAAVPYRFATGVYGVAGTASADVYRWFIASGESAFDAGRHTQDWIDAQVVAGGDAVTDAGRSVVDWLLGRDPAAVDDAFFGGGSSGGDGFGGSWGDVDDDVYGPVAPDPSHSLGALQDIFISSYGHLPVGVEYVGESGHGDCFEVCEWRGRGLNASRVCTSRCASSSSYANFIADHLSVVSPSGGDVYGPPAPSGDVYGPPAPSGDVYGPPAPSGDGTGNAGIVPSSGPGMPDYS